MEKQFLLSSVVNQINSTLCKTLKLHGYVILSLDTLTLNEIEIFQKWEEVFSSVFGLEEQMKANITSYTSIKGYTLGYRKDGLREFIETRLEGLQNVLPSIEFNQFNQQVKEMFKIFKEITKHVLTSMAITIGIEPTYFLNLIDEETLQEEEISSSVLRICSYPFDSHHSKDSQISFGAHTDTTFITIGTFSSTSGLEIQDFVTKKWISVEDSSSSSNTSSLDNDNTDTVTNYPKVAIFVGDVMHLLSNGFYPSTIHRVRTYHRHPTHHCQVPRVSCPFLVRGRHKSKIPSIYQCQRFPSLLPSPSLSSSSPSSSSSVPLPPPVPANSSSEPIVPVESVEQEEEQQQEEEDQEESTSQIETNSGIVELSDFEGMNMKLIHTILDKKRQKCMKENQKTGDENEYPSDEENTWVLKAFP